MILERLKAAWLVFLFDVDGRMSLLAGHPYLKPKYWRIKPEMRFLGCWQRIQSKYAPRVTWLG